MRGGRAGEDRTGDVAGSVTGKASPNKVFKGRASELSARIPTECRSESAVSVGKERILNCSFNSNGLGSSSED